MKKTYKNPSLTVVKIQPAQFIATSGPRMYGKNATKAGMARESRFSDDDWEEE